MSSNVRNFVIGTSRSDPSVNDVDFNITSYPIFISVEDEKKNTPESFSLKQNYPNPFNAITRFQFSLPIPGNVTLKIFNLKGEEVETLVDEYRTAGFYEIFWDGGQNPSGIYLARLISDENQVTKKMILEK